MSMLNYIVSKLKNGLITFINMVTLANRDYPYHDCMVDTSTATDQTYVVGTNNLNLRGDHYKLFVSKSTLIYSTTDIYVSFNHVTNVDLYILANTWYEFKSNIWQVFYRYVTVEGALKMYFEGVLPEESRRSQ